MSLVIVFPTHQTSLVERNRVILARSVRPASAAVAKARFRGGRREPDARLHYLSKEKLLSGLCHDRTSLALMRLDDASVVCAKHRARHPRFVERLLREITRGKLCRIRAMRRNRIPFFKNRKMEKVVTRGVQHCPINSVIKRPSDLREIDSHATPMIRERKIRRPIMIRINKFLTALAVGLAVSALATPSFAQRSEGMSSERPAAIRDCNVQAGKYKQYLWGDYEIDVYRA